MWILLLAFVLPTQARAIENTTLFTGGAFLANTSGASGNGTTSTPSLSIGGAVTFSYRFEDWQFSFSSHISRGATSEFFLQESNLTLAGRGRLSSQSFSFPVRRRVYATRMFERSGDIFLLAGPSALFSTIKVKQSYLAGTLGRDTKITSSAFGLELGIGFEDRAEKKEEHPTYLQFLYSVHWPQKYSVVDISNPKQVRTVFETRGGSYRPVHTVMVEAGILVF